MVKYLFYAAWSLATTTDYERATIHRKPTHTDRLLDQSSYNPTSHKATTITNFDETSATSLRLA